ncbi:hypothetical protein [Paenibacillus anaericanus]|uniref:hypothetical protein n=1 Tax=Paenibacillus anaericanus TaxID=170367 RepID=UPI0014774066|nr:hypothetical protein [Paenibacillus anaericanus]
MKTDRQLRELMAFFLSMEERMQCRGRLLIALHARKQYTLYRKQLSGTWRDSNVG